MAYKIILSAEARRELREATGYYVQVNSAIGAGFLEDYETIEKRIRDNPDQFPYFDKPTRKAVFSRRFPYSVLFIIEGEVARIFSIFHHSRKPGNWTQ